MTNKLHILNNFRGKVRDMTQSAIRKILKYRLARYLVGVVASFFIFGAVFLLGSSLIREVYYKVMPGSWFIDYYSVVADNAQAGDDVNVTLCRTLRYDKPKVAATRTFFYEEMGGDFKSVAQYDFEPELEKSDNPCVTVSIPPDKQPQKVGKYKFYTELEFYVHGDRNCTINEDGCDLGERKISRYTSNEYKIEENEDSLKQSLEELKQRQKILQQRLRDLNQSQPTDQQTTLPQASAPSAANDSGSTPNDTPAGNGGGNSGGGDGGNNNGGNSQPQGYTACVAGKEGILSTIGGVVSCL